MFYTEQSEATGTTNVALQGAGVEEWRKLGRGSEIDRLDRNKQLSIVRASALPAAYVVPSFRHYIPQYQAKLETV